MKKKIEQQFSIVKCKFEVVPIQKYILPCAVLHSDSHPCLLLKHGTTICFCHSGYYLMHINSVAVLLLKSFSFQVSDLFFFFHRTFWQCNFISKTFNVQMNASVIKWQHKFYCNELLSEWQNNKAIQLADPLDSTYFLHFFPLTYDQQHVSFWFCLREKQPAERNQQKHHFLFSLTRIPECWQVSLPASFSNLDLDPIRTEACTIKWFHWKSQNKSQAVPAGSVAEIG